MTILIKAFQGYKLGNFFKVASVHQARFCFGKSVSDLRLAYFHDEYDNKINIVFKNNHRLEAFLAQHLQTEIKVIKQKTFRDKSEFGEVRISVKQHKTRDEVYFLVGDFCLMKATLRFLVTNEYPNRIVQPQNNFPNSINAAFSLAKQYLDGYAIHYDLSGLDEKYHKFAFRQEFKCC